MPDVEAPMVPTGPASSIALHDVCAQVGGVYGSGADGGEFCQIPPFESPAAPDLVVPVHPEIEVKTSPIIEE